MRTAREQFGWFGTARRARIGAIPASWLRLAASTPSFGETLARASGAGARIVANAMARGQATDRAGLTGALQ
jgi:hypothetical protein